ncbi:hypothetical protein PISMIDRAFT_175112 [Pisolithus microcarpus 441]|uniref:Uncharacterized protein n=1 Tax=Pisolithus microcarpus 441 TaxID=765257 RepID=A0A0C9Y228_9AGAM|nr:hypothetical protein PISMIDRAFT_175112 [Pisolithus microcarpus 441]
MSCTSPASRSLVYSESRPPSLPLLFEGYNYRGNYFPGGGRGIASTSRTAISTHSCSRPLLQGLHSKVWYHH